ncbi:MAG TPA: hypothetical protein VHO50_12015 [Bacteroidales bacterium]|nr:hypothetical protein [Bacteroidales bacterium]
MKKVLIVLFLILPTGLSAQLSNDYPQAGPVRISDYSPNLILQRNTNEGGFVQGIQTKLFDGTYNWFFGNLHQGHWIVSKGDYQGIKFSIQENGFVGIGTDSPAGLLSLKNNSKEFNILANQKLTGYWPPISEVATFTIQASGDVPGNIAFASGNTEHFRLTSLGNLGVGTTNPDSKLTISDGGAGSYLLNVGGTGNGKIKVRHIDGKHWSSTEVDNLYFQHGINKNTIINAGGSTGGVGIGIMDPGIYKLNVSGKIRADEIVVNTSGADFVFDPGYNLLDLAEVEKYIEENKHLPDVAPASEMQSDGMNVSEMQTKLLQKVEELTIYLIEQQKEIEMLKELLNQHSNEENESI